MLGNAVHPHQHAGSALANVYSSLCQVRVSILALEFALCVSIHIQDVTGWKAWGTQCTSDPLRVLMVESSRQQKEATFLVCTRRNADGAASVVSLVCYDRHEEIRHIGIRICSRHCVPILICALLRPFARKFGTSVFIAFGTRSCSCAMCHVQRFLERDVCMCSDIATPQR